MIKPPWGNSLLDWALSLAAEGRKNGTWKIFQCVENGKEPVSLLSWPAVATNDPDAVTRMWTERPNCNIGLAIQPGFVVADVDMNPLREDGPANRANYEAKQASAQPFPDSLRFKSANAGLHIFLATGSDNVGCGKMVGYGDYKGVGGYVVGPGSVYVDAKTGVTGHYTVDVEAAIAPMPDHVADLFKFKPNKDARRKALPPEITEDSKVNQERFVNWLTGVGTFIAKPCIQGQGGNKRMSDTFAMGSSYGLGYETTKALIAGHFNVDPHCQPTFTERELDRIGGYKSADSDYGNLAWNDDGTDPKDNAIFKLYVRPPGGVMCNLAAMPAEIPPREFILGAADDGWLPKGIVSMLYGPGGEGKTQLGLQLALCVETGAPFFGIPTVKTPTLLVLTEENSVEVQRRLTGSGADPASTVRWIACADKDWNTILYSKSAPADKQTTMYQCIADSLKMMDEQHPGHKFLILDNLAHFFGGNYIDVAEVMNFAKLCLGKLCRDHDCTLLMMAHPSQSGKNTGTGTNGSVAWENVVRARLYFDKGLLSRKKSNYAAKHEEGQGLALKWENGCLRLKTDEEKAKPVKKSKAPASAESLETTLLLFRDSAYKVIGNNMAKNWETTDLCTEISADMKSGITGAELKTKIVPALIASPHMGRLRRNGKYWRLAPTVH